MNADKTWQNYPEQTACTARPAGTRPTLTSLGAMRVRKRQVLVLHGDEEIRRLIAISLTLEGFDATTAADRQDCLYKARAIMPDILITTSVNIYEPDEYGTAALLRRHLANSRIKILLINVVPELGAAAMVSARVDACLTTPFDPAEMIRTVRNLAGASQPDLQGANP